MGFNIQTANGIPLRATSNADGTADLGISEAYFLAGPTQVLALSATAAQSTVYGSGDGNPVQVRVIGSQPFYALVGATPTAASATSAYFGASTDGKVILVPDQKKISVLQAGTGGNVWLTVVA